MSTTYFWPGETVRLRVKFTGEDGEPTTVAGLAMSYRAPGATSPTAIPASVIVADGPGSYYTDLPLPTSGDWAVRATCTTPTASAVEVGFSVLRSAVV
jgi:hypothetical protein